MIPEEQYELWEQQFREEVYPSSQDVLTSDDEEGKEVSFVEDSFEKSDCETPDPKTKFSIKTQSLDETEYFFNDSDDEHLQAVADIFQCTTTPIKKDVQNGHVQQDSAKSEVVIPDSDDESPIRMRKNTPRRSVARRQLSFSDDDEDEDPGPQVRPKTSKSRPQVLSSLSSLASSSDSHNEILTQRSQGVIHWQSFQDGSQEPEEIEVEGDEENIEVVSQWVTETQLDRKIDSNEAAQKIIKRRAAQKSNPFLDDEAEDAYDAEECFYDDYESQQVHDTSLADFVADEPASDHGPSEYHLKSLLSQNSQPFKMPQRFVRRAPNADLSIISDTTEEDVDEDESDMDSSFVCDDIEYNNDPTPQKVIQTQQMRLRSKRLVERRKGYRETPDKPIAKRRRRILIESPD